MVGFLKEKLGKAINIVLVNDCHWGAMTEYRKEVGKYYRYMLYCPVSIGISSGNIFDGKLFRGSNRVSRESGRMLTAI